MGALRLGPAGAALGTTLSQARERFGWPSASLSKAQDAFTTVEQADFRARKRHDERHRCSKSACRWRLQDGLHSGVLHRSSPSWRTMRGLTDAAAVGIVEKIISIPLPRPQLTLLSTVSALGGPEHRRGQVRPCTDDILRYAIAIGGGLTALVIGPSDAVHRPPVRCGPSPPTRRW